MIMVTRGSLEKSKPPFSTPIERPSTSSAEREHKTLRTGYIPKRGGAETLTRLQCPRE